MHKFIAESGAVQASNARQLANEPTAPATDSVTLIYDVRLITPMFGGGTAAGTPDMDMPFRTKFIKGALRHWWRLLARAGCGVLQY